MNEWSKIFPSRMNANNFSFYDLTIPYIVGIYFILNLKMKTL